MMRIPNARYYFVQNEEYFEITTKNGGFEHLCADLSQNGVSELNTILKYLDMPIGMDSKQSKLERIKAYLENFSYKRMRPYPSANPSSGWYNLC